MVLNIISKLSKDEVIRYDRQLKYLGIKGQLKLKESSVLVVGAGGLGSSVLLYLTAAGVGRIMVVDKEEIELSNLNRQILYSTDDVGKPKADVAVKKLSLLNPHVKLEPYKIDVKEKKFEELVKEADVIVDCLDNWSARFRLNELAVKNKKPLIHAGVKSMYGQLMVIIPGETPCLNCLLPKPPAEETGIPIIGTTPGILGILEANETIKLLTGLGKVLKNRLLLIDLVRTEFTLIDIRRNPSCPTCSKYFKYGSK